MDEIMEYLKCCKAEEGYANVPMWIIVNASVAA